MTDTDRVSTAFFWLLGRSPESQQVVEDHEGLSDEALRNRILSSMEFREYYRSRFLSEHRFFFIRVPKTASTTVIACLKNAGIEVLHLDNKIDGAGSPIRWSVDLLREYSRYKVASGHICYGDVLPSLGGMRPIFLAQVREPIRRAISLYHQAVSEQHHPCHQDVNGRTLAGSLELEGSFYEWVYNAQCRFISSHHFFESTSAHE
jgi:hypothetical protein